MSQQQRLADIASLRLTQYLVRLPEKEDGVKGLLVKRKSDAKEIPNEEAKKEKDSDISGEDDDESDDDEEGEEDMDDDLGDSDDEDGENEIDEEGSYH